MSSDWFLTYSTADIGQLDEKVLLTLLQGYSSYHFIEEYGRKGNHAHWHGYVHFDTQTRSDNVRRIFRKVFTDPEYCTKLSFVVKQATDVDGLMVYLVKEQDCRTLCTTYGADQLDPYIARSRRTLSEALDGNKRKQVSVVGAADSVLKFAKAEGLELYTRREFQNVIHVMMLRNYRFDSIWGRLKHVWVQCNVLNGNVDIPFWKDEE